MTNRSVFPNAVDQFQYLSEVLASDKSNIDRYRQLLMQATRTSDEDVELNNLKTTLYNAGKVVTSESFNKIFDCMTNLENFFLMETVPYLDSLDVGALRTDIGFPTNLTTTNKTNVVAAINEIMTTSAKKQQENWFDLVLMNGWVNFGTPQATAQFMKDGMEFVHIKGLVKNGITSVGDWVSSPLPVGYRPKENMMFSCATANGATVTGDANITIESSGAIVMNANVGNGYLNLSDIKPFRAEL